MRVRAPSLPRTSTPLASTPTTRESMRSSTPRRSSSLVALPESRSPKVASGSLASVEQQHPDGGRIDVAELAAQRARRQLADLPGQLHTRRAGADDDDREPTVALDRVGRRLGHLEGAEEAPAELQGVVDRLHARRVEGELVVAEVRLAGAGGDDQTVVGQLDRAQVGGRRGVDHAGVEIEAGHLGEHHARRCRSVARRGVSAVRSGPARACPSPPGTAAAGRGGGCGGRPP